MYSSHLKKSKIGVCGRRVEDIFIAVPRQAALSDGNLMPSYPSMFSLKTHDSNDKNSHSTWGRGRGGGVKCVLLQDIALPHTTQLRSKLPL